jgi:hypothetical protein
LRACQLPHRFRRQTAWQQPGPKAEMPSGEPKGTEAKAGPSSRALSENRIEHKKRSQPRTT